ncbi:MAG: dienelactone hydrolase family protein [Gammaproteobacteria bacterium]|nr:dienelactone hydrolase family protein [Gammaproteobacteria bacterium]
MQTQPLKTIEITPTNNPGSSVIWLHGLGADGHDFADLAQTLHESCLPTTRFILPHAPIVPITINGGYQMRAWFDVYGLTEDSPQDRAGIQQSQQLIEQLINKELELGIASDKIILAGFSQGGAMALQCGLRYPQKLAGILALSAFLPLAEALKAEAAPANQNAPIFMTHGEHDDVLPITWAKASRDKLTELDYKLKWATYPMAHQLCDQEIIDISCWLKELLAR